MTEANIRLHSATASSCGCHSPNESGVDVGSVDHGVAGNARLHFRGTGTHAMDRPTSYRAVTLVAHLVDIRNVQQACVLGTMR